MVEFLQLLLLVLAIILSLAGVGFQKARILSLTRGAVAKPNLSIAALGCAAFLGCFAIACLVHEPVPRIHDEFSYALMSDTFASGHVATPSPPLPEFFDTFHVLMRPVYASKYFPAQGVFLAIGEKLTGHPAVGVWLSSALACAATCWMLHAWAGPAWGMLGGFLMLVQIGVYSYWSQSYWGGMVAALGGALLFGAARRLWDRLSWQYAVWLAVGLVILVNSRPLEGLLAAIPVGGLLLLRFAREGVWKTPEFWYRVMLPAGTILILGAVATGAYNRAITGSIWEPPYLLHERQYQESPQFSFLPLRPKITYSSPWLQYYYEVKEMRPYMSQRTPANLMITAARKLMTWWAFYCGVLLSAPLVLPVLLRRGWIRYAQVAVLAGFVLVAAIYEPRFEATRFMIDVLAAAQIILLWLVFDNLWTRLAIGISVAIIVEGFFVKYAFPHYFAPAASLVLFLQVDGLKKLWQWNPATNVASETLTRRERRREATRKKGQPMAPYFRWRGFVTLLPIVCLLSLGLRVEARINDWSEDVHGVDRDALPMNDWSLRRAEMERWLEHQSGSQLVFVRYSPRHNVDYEWVFNRSDLMNSRVIWARDLGAEHNQLLLDQLVGRTVWSLEADRPDPQLVPYSEARIPENAYPASRSAEDAPSDQ
jgi:hypothetical protein